MLQKHYQEEILNFQQQMEEEKEQWKKKVNTLQQAVIILQVRWRKSKIKKKWKKEK